MSKAGVLDTARPARRTACGRPAPAGRGALVCIHSEWPIGDIIRSLRYDYGAQFELAGSA